MADQSTEFVGSHEKAQNGYGQNGYQGASSDLPGKHTYMNRDYGVKSDPDVSVTGKPGETGNWQTRNVSKEPYAPTFGMKSPGEPAKVPSANGHAASKPTVGKTGGFQR